MKKARKAVADPDVDASMLQTETALISAVLDRRAKPLREVSYKLGLMKHLRDPELAQLYLKHVRASGDK